MKKLFTIFLLLTLTNLFAQTNVNSLSELRAAVLNSNQTITMARGSYNFEDLPSDSRDITISGNNNRIILTGVFIDVPVGSVGRQYIIVSGNNNTIIDGDIEDVYRSGITEVTDFSAYNQDRENLANGLRGDPVMLVSGDDNTIDGIKLTVRGSFPYGYGSMYGIGAGNMFGLDKRCGLLINGSDNVIDGVEIQQRAFGHGLFVQGDADNNIVRNTLVEGRVRRTAELYSETNSFDLPFRSNYLTQDGDPIARDEVHSLCEDGIRMYNIPGSIEVENCTVKKMRGGIRLYLGGPATVNNSIATDCGDTNFNMPSGGEITNSSGNFSYAPLSDFRLSRNNMDLELTIIPSPNAEGPHNLADVQGDNHNIIFHRTPGPIDDDEARAILITGNNSTIINETEYRIILESSTSGNRITSCGPVIDNGSRNNVTLSNSCDFDPIVNPSTSTFIPDPNKTYYLDVPQHNVRLAATGESEDAFTTPTTNTGDDVQWRFVAKGNGSWHVQRAAGGTKPRLRSDGTEKADMQETTSNGTFTYFNMEATASGDTYFFTLPDGPLGYTRLQVTPDGNINMVPGSYDGGWESFRITEAGGTGGGSSPVHITKRNAGGFAIDGNRGGENGQNIYLYDGNDANVNQQWAEIDRGNGYYSYQKQGTDFCIDGGRGGANDQNVYLWQCGASNQNQQWQKVPVGGGAFKLIKRNAPEYALNGGNGGTNLQNVNLYDASATSQNLHWLITPISSSSTALRAAITENEEISILPNPVTTELTVRGVAGSAIVLYDINGRSVIERPVAIDAEILDLSELKDGMYIIEVQLGEKIISKKIIKQ